jgi:hypothetical protein
VCCCLPGFEVFDYTAWSRSLSLSTFMVIVMVKVMVVVIVTVTDSDSSMFMGMAYVLPGMLFGRYLVLLLQDAQTVITHGCGYGHSM